MFGLGVCMGWVEEYFQSNPPLCIKRNPIHHKGPTQPTWIGLDPWFEYFFLITIVIIKLSIRTTQPQTILNFDSASKFKPTSEIKRRLK